MSDAREIYQAVMEQCTKKIESIKSEYGNQLAEMVMDQIAKEYESRILYLESENKELLNRIVKIEQQIQNQQKKFNNNKSPSSIKNSTKSEERITIDTSIRVSSFEFNGWLYYANEKMGNFLYKVRIDGTCNQQLTDYSVDEMMTGSRVKNGKLEFRDADYNIHFIDL